MAQSPDLNPAEMLWRENQQTSMNCSPTVKESMPYYIWKTDKVIQKMITFSYFCFYKLPSCVV